MPFLFLIVMIPFGVIFCSIFSVHGQRHDTSTSDTLCEPFSFIFLKLKLSANLLSIRVSDAQLSSLKAASSAVVDLLSSVTSDNFLNLPYRSLVGLKPMLSVKLTIFFGEKNVCSRLLAQVYFNFKVVVWALKTIFCKRQ